MGEQDSDDPAAFADQVQAAVRAAVQAADQAAAAHEARRREARARLRARGEAFKSLFLAACQAAPQGLRADDHQAAEGRRTLTLTWVGSGPGRRLVVYLDEAAPQLSWRWVRVTPRGQPAPNGPLEDLTPGDEHRLHLEALDLFGLPQLRRLILQLIDPLPWLAGRLPE
jgi:hypothetical protein